MRSRPARLIFGATALIASAAAGFFLIDSERQIAGMRKALRSFDLSAREATDALAEMRAAEAAYVGVGQGPAFWVAKVAATRDSAAGTIATLRQQAAASIEARAALDEAASTLVEFGQAD